MGKKPEFTIVIDTREQTPWTWGEGTLTVVKALPTGDYSIEGFEKEIAIERKNLNDLAQTVIKDKKRFHKELFRFAMFHHKAVFVEASLEDVLEHRYNSGADPMAVVGSVMWFSQVHGIPFYFWGDRQMSEFAAKQWLRQAWKISCIRNKNGPHLPKNWETGNKEEGE